MSSGANRPSDGEADHEPERSPAASEYLTILQRGLDRYGEAFVAYLILDGVDQTAPDIVERFKDRYAGWFLDRHGFMRAQLDALGWEEALEQFKAEHEIWPGALNFNWERLWEHCLEVYDVEERLPGLHAFWK